MFEYPSTLGTGEQFVCLMVAILKMAAILQILVDHD